MKRQIKELQESAEQTRAGLLGEAQEREIEDVLREKFRPDRIEPVKSGVRGADVLQSVYSPRGECCGKILWESKRARNWSNGWISKLKEDQAAAGADVAVLVCSALPVGVRHMELVDGVWIVGFAYVVGDGYGALRQATRSESHRRGASTPTATTRLHEIYDYLTSNDFNRRVARDGRVVRRDEERPRVRAPLDGADVDEAREATRRARAQHSRECTASSRR